MHLKPEEENNRVFVLNLLFSVPFILFSMTGGYLADRFSKRTVTIGTKLFEMAVMLLAIVAFAQENLPLALSAVFLASTQAALFGPSKYGLLPELLPQEELSWGNGVIELRTFLAIISAVIAAGFLSDTFRGRQLISGLLFLSCSVAGLACAFAITRVPAADPSRTFRANVFGDLWAQGCLIRADRVLWLAVLEHLLLVFRGLAAKQCDFLRRETPADRQHPQRPAPSLSRHRHRLGQFGGRFSFRGENRIRTNSSWRAWHDGLWIRAVRSWRAPCKGGAFQWVQIPPGNRSSRKQPEQSWR
jgi:MFS family permease